MRAAVLQILLTVAAVAAIACSCVWAWASSDFWRTVPLYPAVAVAGLLSGSASQAWRREFARAAAVAAGATLTTLLGTAVITLARGGW